MAAIRTNLEKSAVLRRKLADLPLRPGCYLYRDEKGNLLYVGKAKVLRNRVKSYFQQKRLDAKTRRLVARIWDLEFIVCETELEALILENNLIKEHFPPFNILLRDDKSYPYVKLTWKEAFPKAFVTRKVRKDGSLYFGPFFPASTAYRAVELVYRFFQIRDCDIEIDGKRGRACLKYQLHRCTAPCIAAVSQEAYREQAKEARLFLEGKRDELKARLEAAMWKAAEAAAFEQAAQHRDALQQVDAWFTRQKAASADLEDTDIYGSALLDGQACVHRLLLRDGRMVGRQEYLLDEVEVFDGEVLAQVLQRVYSTEPPPSRLLVETEPANGPLLCDWLTGLRGTRVRIRVPQKGEKVDLLAMAQENARMALERKFEPARLNEAVLEGLQAFLGLSHLPRRIECFDISHGQGTRGGGQLRGLHRRPAGQGPLPSLQDDRAGERRLRQHARGRAAPLPPPAGRDPGLSLPGAHRRRPGAAPRGAGRTGGAGPRPAGAGQPRQEGRARVPTRPGGPAEDSEVFTCAAAAAAHPRRGAPLCRDLPPSPAGQAHAPDRAHSDPGHWTCHRQEAATGLWQRHRGAGRH